MSVVDETQEALEDAKFERLLLDSARVDALPDDDVERAFQRFSASIGLASLDVTGSSHVVRAAHRALLKWLAIAGVGAGAVSAVWLGLARPGTSNSASLSSHPPAAPPSAAANVPSALVPPSAVPRSPASRDTVSSAEVASRPHPLPSGARKQGEAAYPRPAKIAASASAVEPGRPSPPSTLLAEVALLDSVRAKLALEDPSGALRLVERYEREFPNGQLANEAEVLAIEALAAAANHGELARRGQRFLRYSPQDPHAPEVRRLLER